MTSTAQQRLRFNRDIAPLLVDALDLPVHPLNKPTRMFAHFGDDESLVIVAGPQEGSDIQRALARGLGERGGRRLVLLLPERHTLATELRSAWLSGDARPKIYLHDGSHLVSDPPEPVPPLDRPSSLAAFTDRLGGQSLQGDFDAATIPKHLGGRSVGVIDLVEWATTDPRLTPAHLRDTRSWHHMGQKVLSVQTTSAGLRITAGIHYSKAAQAPEPIHLPEGASLAPSQLQDIQQRVEAAIATRTAGHLYKPDEHWLQAVIRRDPSLVGVEQPALREVPTWRPQDTPRRWGRGYADLIGLDGHGDIRIVETKLASNADELLILQGLDYFLWATAYREMLTRRLGAPKAARLELHFVIGADAEGQARPHPYAKAQADSLDPSISWRFQTVAGWFTEPPRDARRLVTQLPDRTVPPATAAARERRETEAT
jgi:hypothetical protein